MDWRTDRRHCYCRDRLCPSDRGTSPVGEIIHSHAEVRELVTHGLYSRLRNPIYVFVDLMLFGLILVFGRLWLLAPLAVLVLGQILQSRSEATVLQAKFGQAYLSYRAQTWF